MKRRIVSWLCGSLLVGVTGVCLFWTPARFCDRLRPIPAHAQIVYNNEDPDGFLSFFPSVFAGGSVAIERVGDILEPTAVGSKGWKKYVQRLEAFPLMVAVVQGAGQKAWIAVSELGGSGAMFRRWALLLNRPEGVEPVRSYAAWPVWKFEHPSLPSWARVRFCVTDGLLICSISRDSRDIFRLIDIVDGRAASREDRRR